MSCNNNCDPCNNTLNETESASSMLSNLSSSLFGSITKTVTNGRAVWSQPCDAYASLSCFTRNAGEGLICYLLRIFADFFTPLIGVHNSANSYCKGNLVTSSASFYKAIVDVPIGVAITNTAYWSLLLTAPSGPTGATGPAGSGSAINYAVTTKTGNYTASDTDAVIFCDPSANMTITLPAANAVSGKWYKIINRTGAFTVTVLRAGSDTINGATSMVLNAANDGLTFVNDNGTKWSAF